MKKMDKDKSTAVRDLVELGRIYFALSQYKEGTISLGKAAEIVGLPLSEMMDILSRLGIKNNVGLEDYLGGQKLAQTLFSKRITT